MNDNRNPLLGPEDGEIDPGLAHAFDAAIGVFSGAILLAMLVASIAAGLL